MQIIHLTNFWRQCLHAVEIRNRNNRKQAVYSACYGPAKEIMQECYNEVRSGNEIRSVVMQGARLNDINTGKIDGTFTWKASLDSDPVEALPCDAEYTADRMRRT